MPKVSAVRQIDKDTVAVAAQGNEVLVLPENIFTMCTDFLDVDRITVLLGSRSVKKFRVPYDSFGKNKTNSFASSPYGNRNLFPSATAQNGPQVA